MNIYFIYDDWFYYRLSKTSEQCYNRLIFLTNSLMTETSLTYPCPRCHTPTTWTDNPNRPFCSERCKLIDLGAWASEDYKIAAEDSPFSDDLNNSNTIN